MPGCYLKESSVTTLDVIITSGYSQSSKLTSQYEKIFYPLIITCSSDGFVLLFHRFFVKANCVQCLGRPWLTLWFLQAQSLDGWRRWGTHSCSGNLDSWCERVNDSGSLLRCYAALVFKLRQPLPFSHPDAITTGVFSFPGTCRFGFVRSFLSSLSDDWFKT